MMAVGGASSAADDGDAGKVKDGLATVAAPFRMREREREGWWGENATNSQENSARSGRCGSSGGDSGEECGMKGKEETARAIFFFFFGVVARANFGMQY